MSPHPKNGKWRTGPGSLSTSGGSTSAALHVKLLETILTDDLKWSKNMREIVTKAYARMQLLHWASNFTSNVQDLKSIYLTYIRSVQEQSAVVWHSGLKVKNRRDLQWVQKAAVRVILKTKYTTYWYKEGLRKLKIETLEQRREQLCLKFAQNCLKNEKVRNVFHKKKNIHQMKKRKG